MTQGLCTIGVDVGTTDVKVIAVAPDGRIVARQDAPIAMLRVAPGAAEQDPHAVYEIVTATFADAVRQAQALGYAVARVGMSAGMHSLLAVGPDNQPLTRALTWMDTRAAAQAEALWASPQGPAIYARTGTPIHAMSPLAKLIWLRQSQPELHQRAARFVSLKEWLWYQWFGAWQIDHSIASATGLYALREQQWDAEALTLAGVTPAQLSALVPTTTTRAGLREPRLLAVGLSATTPFTIGASDGVLANLAVGALDAQRMALTIGTSVAARVGAATPITDPATRIFCYTLAADRYIVGAASNNGGGVVDWLAHRALAGPGDLGALIAAAEHTAVGDLLCLPYIAGERSPLWDARAQGVFWGLTTQTDALALMRAAIEGIIFNAYWLASDLFPVVGRPAALLASGRLLESGWIRQLVADVFDLPVILPDGADASAMGAVALATIAGGAASWEDVQRRAAAPSAPPAVSAGSASAEAPVLRRGMVTAPQPEAHTRLQTRYQRYRRLCDVLRAGMGAA